VHWLGKTVKVPAPQQYPTLPTWRPLRLVFHRALASYSQQLQRWAQMEEWSEECEIRGLPPSFLIDNPMRRASCQSFIWPSSPRASCSARPLSLYSPKTLDNSSDQILWERSTTHTSVWLIQKLLHLTWSQYQATPPPPPHSRLISFPAALSRATSSTQTHLAVRDRLKQHLKIIWRLWQWDQRQLVGACTLSNSCRLTNTT